MDGGGRGVVEFGDGDGDSNVGAGTSDADLAPLQHVADAFMLGKRNLVEAFFD